MMKYPDYVLDSKAVTNRLHAEATFDCSEGDGTKGHFWCLTQVPSDRCVGVRMNFTPSMTDIEPHELQKSFAKELLLALNKEVGHDGGWVVGFTHPPAAWHAFHVDGDNAWARMFCLWLDADGDPQFTFDTELPFVEVYGSGTDGYIQQCSQAYREWEKMLGKQGLKDLGIKDDQLIREAMGQKAPAPIN